LRNVNLPACCAQLAVALYAAASSRREDGSPDRTLAGQVRKLSHRFRLQRSDLARGMVPGMTPWMMPNRNLSTATLPPRFGRWSC
jgi:hypothetical protein